MIRPAPKLDRATREVRRTDRRWLLLTSVVFAVTLGGFAGGLALYRWTGPHPRITLFTRQIKDAARWVVPRKTRARRGWW